MAFEPTPLGKDDLETLQHLSGQLGASHLSRNLAALLRTLLVAYISGKNAKEDHEAALWMASQFSELIGAMEEERANVDDRLRLHYLATGDKQ